MPFEAPQLAATPPSQYDELPPTLERALFRRFWTSLVIVSSVIFAVGSGLSAFASQLIASVIDERVRVANGRIDNLVRPYQIRYSENES
ncbi:hypothetical protein BRDID11004_07380 [Bradyrhizobium diazoefficiens]|uniref:Uncharacterized protein n=1 Tax=Bradyrhizobium diazoefficiens TaxID=1355477 RepID=A0A810CEM4_9BRAD|nr:hypothetical protein H12S4_82690 [Bradyrhizobium diazoefficiens]BCA16038.1 hypothetical protein BDHF08_78850 [Bradyrhizobium diazoefficiens]BCA24716.1 hypothetical protein BDHH15_79310 [Bradyrhizobium diazoefficiens]BCE25456.1 hypothetical protein XF1B_81370 [Bradyrhizobium diazoefficiens]BCE34212.1 hypothetical protein XF2B_79810 [Bradyrhizobium diazoefficiens]